MTFDIRGCALSETAVDAILQAFVDAGYDGAGTKTLRLDGGTNATPSGSGLANKTTLQNDLGWNVVTN